MLIGITETRLPGFPPPQPPCFFLHFGTFGFYSIRSWRKAASQKCFQRERPDWCHQVLEVEGGLWFWK